MKEFGEAIKTQLAASNPVKLRKQELEQEKRRSSMTKKMTRSPSRKRNSSVSQLNASPDTVSRTSGNFGPSSILKSVKKLKKLRPKTAEKVSSGYKPTRSIYKPEISASAGQNYSPYQVPNVAVISSPAPFNSNKQVSFAAGQKRQMDLADRSPLRQTPRGSESYSKLPQERSQSPLRSRSPMAG
jgi:hypothetical protein